MDISKEYIKMCAEAEEIQELKKGGNFTEGDIYANEKWNSSYNIYIAGNYEVDFPDNEFCKWLPRQDQLQSLLLAKDKAYLNNADHLLEDFYDHYKEVKDCLGTAKTYATYEMSWLHFFMVIEHGQEWNAITETWELVKDLRE